MTSSRRVEAGALLGAGLVFFVAVTATTSAQAQHRAPVTPEPPYTGPTYFADVSVGYYHPTDGDHQVRSTFANALIGGELWRDVGLDVYAGVSFAGASGYVLQQAGSGRKDVFGVGTAGVGPVVAIRFDPLRKRVFSVGAEVLGGILFYGRPFPPHGDVYEIAFRVGGVIAVTPDPRFRIELAIHWMHVSVDGLGFSLGVQIVL